MQVSTYTHRPMTRPHFQANSPTPPPQDPKDDLTPGEEEDIKNLLKTALPAAYAGGGIAAVAGAAAGYGGGFVGGLAGTTAAVGLGLAGAALGGWAGLEIGMRAGEDKGGLGLLLIVGTTAAGVLVGGTVGLYGGGALGAIAGASGGVAGAVAGAVGLGPIGAALGEGIGAVVEYSNHPEKYPNLGQEE